MDRIQNKAAWGLVVALSLLVLAALAGVVRGGPLDPTSPPGPTGKNVITSLPFTISQPGSYVLNGNLTGSSGDGITIQADNVSIDLNGFTLSGAGGISGISEGPTSPTRQGWTVRNGTIANWQNSAIFGQHLINSTFEDLKLAGNGISGKEALRADRAITVRNVKATDNHGNGIALGAHAQVSDCSVEVFYPNTTGIVGADQSTIRDCTVTGNLASGSSGISAGDGSEVSHSTVRSMGGLGIAAGTGGTIADCTAEGGAGGGIQISPFGTVRGCTAVFNGGIGIQTFNDATVEDCVANGNGSGGGNGSTFGVLVNGDNSIIRGCTANNNGVAGNGGGIFINGKGSTLENCSTSGNTVFGISTFDNTTVRECNASNNGLDEIEAGSRNLIENCVVDGFTGSGPGPGDGILVGSNNVIRGCTAQNNAGSGIHITGTNNRVESNHALFNSLAGIKVDSGSNVVVLNSASANSPNYDVAAGNQYSPAAPVSGATNPWANISY